MRIPSRPVEKREREKEREREGRGERDEESEKVGIIESSTEDKDESVDEEDGVSDSDIEERKRRRRWWRRRRRKTTLLHQPLLLLFSMRSLKRSKNRGERRKNGKPT